MIPGMKSLARDLDDLRSQLPPEPRPEDEEARCWLAGLSPEEFARGAEILIDAQPTEADLAFIEALAARAPVDLPKTDPSQPACHACGQQPATEREGSWPICDSCWRAMLGRAYDEL